MPQRTNIPVKQQELICLTDTTSDNDLFHEACSYISPFFNYEIRLPSDIEQLKLDPPKVILSNLIESLGFIDICTVILYITDTRFKPQPTLRRYLKVLRTIECFAASSTLARKFYENFGIPPETPSKEEKRMINRYSNLDALVERLRKQVTERPSQLVERSKLAKQQQLNKIASPYMPMSQIQKTPYKPPIHELLPVPHWFENPGDKEVSAIIPMFHSKDVIAQQIRNWNMNSTLKHEVIYVNDGCPESFQAVITAWSGMRAMYDADPEQDFNYSIGKIVMLGHNSGFATACNIGAGYAQGKYLLFLNADTTVTENWMEPMYELMEGNDNIGIVGNLQLKMDGTIDSAGSEWMWDTKSFDHIGRNVYKGKRLTTPTQLKNAPPEMLQIAERDMVTGCCFMIRKSLFEEVGGFNINYRIGYWEDADLNMKVKSLGYKIYFQPKSIIYHKVGHTNAFIHPYMSDNVRLFYERWMKNGKIKELIL